MILAWLYVLSGGAAEWLYKRGLWPRRWANLWRVVPFLLLASAAFGQDKSDPKLTPAPTCDQTLWVHVYNSQRLGPLGCVAVTGIKQDATHGKKKDGCRREADADFHCWLKLDADPPIQLGYLNDENRSKQDGNLVFEPMCQGRVKQADAKAACKDWKQQLLDAPVGAHLKITGIWVLDKQHGHMEIHPVTSIEVLPAFPKQ